MPSRNPDKNKDVLKDLEKTISPVLVVNNSSLKPYVELFEYAPENIYQQPLGSLVGFFEIKEFSEDSAYIVNFLTSVLKKEYYINPKRPVAESLDSALHKVNMALSELAKNGNVEWLGKLHAAICVLEKNNAHFSVAGSAKIFMFRNQTLSDISDGLASDSLEPHPLKTFVNVSSGRLEKDDRLLITSEDIFHILPVMQLSKNFQRFTGDKFVQFLKTALSNQLEMIANVVIEMKESKQVSETKIASSRKKSEDVANVFSEKTFAKTSKKTNANAENNFDETSKNEEMESEGYTDQKTGHIYVQGEIKEENEAIRANIYWDMTKEKFSQFWFSIKNSTKRQFSIYRKQIAKKMELRRAEKEKQKQIKDQLAIEAKKREQERLALEEIDRKQKMEQEKEFGRIRAEQLATRTRQEDLIESTEENPTNESFDEDTITEEDQEQFAVPELSFKEKLALATKEQRIEPEIISESQLKKTRSLIASAITRVMSYTKKAFTWSISHGKLLSHLIPRPCFSKIKKLYSSFSQKQKVYTFVALALIFIVPIFIARWMNRPKTPTITDLQVIVPTPTQPLAEDKNINLLPQAQTILSDNSIINTCVTDAGTVVTTKNETIIINGDQQKKYPFPENSGTALRSTYMHDLALVLILTDQGKIISFSPVSAKFAANNISLPTDSDSDFIGTYLTYMYVLDSASNQIYRYPRAEGGFGERTNWLKDTTSLSSVSDMTIDENIYAIQNNQVLKLFKGKAIPFTLEVSKTPVNFDKIFTNIDYQSFYALDAKNSRIVQYNKTDGSITAQYYNAKLDGGTSLSVDEPNKTAYVSTSSEFISISLQ